MIVRRPSAYTIHKSHESIFNRLLHHTHTHIHTHRYVMWNLKQQQSLSHIPHIARKYNKFRSLHCLCIGQKLSLHTYILFCKRWQYKNKYHVDSHSLLMPQVQKFAAKSHHRLHRTPIITSIYLFILSSDQIMLMNQTWRQLHFTSLLLKRKKYVAARCSQQKQRSRKYNA